VGDRSGIGQGHLRDNAPQRSEDIQLPVPPVIVGQGTVAGGGRVLHRMGQERMAYNVGGGPRIALQVQRNAAAYHRRRHAGALSEKVLFIGSKQRKIEFRAHQGLCECHQGSHFTRIA